MVKHFLFTREKNYILCLCVCWVLQLCLTLCEPMGCSPPGSSVNGQEYWSGLPCPPPGVFPDPGIEPASLVSPALAGRLFTTRATWEAPHLCLDGALKLLVLLAPVRAVTVVHFLFWTVLPSNIYISFFNMNLSDNVHWFFFPLVQRAYSPNQYLSLRSIEMLFYFTDYKEKHDFKKSHGYNGL